MINIYIVMFNIEGKRKLKRFFIHASDIEDAEKFAYKKLKELENEYVNHLVSQTEWDK